MNKLYVVFRRLEYRDEFEGVFRNVLKLMIEFDVDDFDQISGINIGDSLTLKNNNFEYYIIRCVEEDTR
jgi:hypothetical protein